MDAAEQQEQQELTRQLKYVEEHIGLIHTWPPSIRNIMFKEHPTHGERMHLMLFLLGNAMPPLSVVKVLVPKIKSENAAKHVRQFLLDLRTGTVAKYTYWNLEQKKPEPIGKFQAPAGTRSLDRRALGPPRLAAAAADAA